MAVVPVEALRGRGSTGLGRGAGVGPRWSSLSIVGWAYILVFCVSLWSWTSHFLLPEVRFLTSEKEMFPSPQGLVEMQ